VVHTIMKDGGFLATAVAAISMIVIFWSRVLLKFLSILPGARIIT
jgi:hypothetical protein